MKTTLVLAISLLTFLACSQESTISTQVKLSPLPDSSKIIFHIDNYIYAMDEDGSNLTQISFDDSYTLEHVAVSYDRTKLVSNYFSDPARGGLSSKMLLYDLVQKTVTPLVPDFEMAGNGGVDWDENGYIYFAAVAEFPYENPQTIPEFQANAAANDIYRVKFDGTDLQNLTNTIDRGEADVSVSPDGLTIAYMATDITDPEDSVTEIWKRNTDGQQPELLFTGGKDRVSSVHDPEISPDGKSVVFSQVNNEVPPVFPENPLANTAHDVIRLDFITHQQMKVTVPGPISIAPDWQGDTMLFLEITDKPPFPHAGIATIKSDGTGYKLIKNGSNIGKWIPE
ncbi:MAG: hypothetical protein QNJ57_13140 [Flavobacteriaceae bacterium]|nr:hypothetical protein [Flavobacteriaceae bacterium]